MDGIGGISQGKLCSRFFFFFLSIKSNVIKIRKEPRSTQVVNIRDQNTDSKENKKPPENYLLPIQVKKSITECV